MVKLKAGHKFGDETLTKDEWVQVQKAILYQNKSTMVYRLSNPKYPDSVRKEAITHMAKVANLGYLPALDLAGPAEFPSGAVHSIPFDFDQLAERGKIPANDRAKELDTGIMWLSELNQSNEKELFEVAEKVLNDEMRNALKKVRGTIIN